ncbi:MAG: ABC transporter ATP-binding protein [Solobacterium sp.]|nr:ABC transporter ATP-binding protein [Solobacterium sp.]
MNAIELKNLSKSYPGFELKDLNLTLPAGTIMGLVGENGAGKSTTMKLLLGMIRPDGGSINVLGESDLRARPQIKEEIGVVMEDVSFPSIMKIDEIGKVMAGIYRNWDAAEFARMVKVLRIPEDKKFFEMSRGNRMKTGFACALAHHPRLLLLDEATSGLDPVVRDELLDILMDFTRDENHSILMSSHIVSDLEKACDYVCFLHDGRILLTEEKDLIREQYGKLQVTPEQLAELDPAAIIGRRTTPYGTEVIVRKDRIPALDTQPVDIEELFVFMVKGERQ